MVRGSTNSVCALCQVTDLSFCVYLQERSLAEAENKPLPPKYSSSDVRSLNLSDFKHAHEQVILLLFNLISYPVQTRKRREKNKLYANQTLLNE
jgi:hypothetical protein